ncbi:MAG: hypothetical protein ETSY2_05080 [Candidatus Entotheonella gemina]|uniref:Uncharacterized protein n=1 Tax=Candidatus Entotheonella gemina TaxID=1429439 RepID=W4ME86_9BACT|nr:MAG: hypothetical protein ETSY2_05080 [Candidatus Entotheonella gemina]
MRDRELSRVVLTLDETQFLLGRRMRQRELRTHHMIRYLSSEDGDEMRALFLLLTQGLHAGEYLSNLRSHVTSGGHQGMAQGQQQLQLVVSTRRGIGQRRHEFEPRVAMGNGLAMSTAVTGIFGRQI